MLGAIVGSVLANEFQTRKYTPDSEFVGISDDTSSTMEILAETCKILQRFRFDTKAIPAITNFIESCHYSQTFMQYAAMIIIIPICIYPDNVETNIAFAKNLMNSIYKESNLDDAAAIVCARYITENNMIHFNKKSRNMLNADLKQIIDRCRVSSDISFVIDAIVNAKDFEHAIRNGLGNYERNPVLTTLIGFIASAYYPIQKDLSDRCLVHISREYREILSEYTGLCKGNCGFIYRRPF